MARNLRLNSISWRSQADTVNELQLLGISFPSCNCSCIFFRVLSCISWSKASVISIQLYTNFTMKLPTNSRSNVLCRTVFYYRKVFSRFLTSKYTKIREKGCKLSEAFTIISAANNAFSNGNANS